MMYAVYNNANFQKIVRHFYEQSKGRFQQTLNGCQS